MKVVNKKIMVSVIALLVVIESCTLFLMYKSLNNKKTNLDNVNLKENIDDNMFAIMLEQTDGTYTEGEAWPTDGYIYSEEMSGCMDEDGNKLEGVLSYDNTTNIATVDTPSTSYCYLYFEKASCTVSLTNLIKNGSYESGTANWGLSNASITSDTSYTGSYSLALSPNTTAMSTQTLDYSSPIINHKYYGRVMFKSNANFSVEDNRFEWFVADAENGMIPFAFKSNATADWILLSSVGVITSDTYSSKMWGIRNFVVNSNSVSYTDDLMIIDLTAAFGSGNEPSAEWLDKNLTYFETTGSVSFKPVKDAPNCP